MAIQVNGTTVINNSRALTNITSVDATTAAAIGNAGVGGGGSIELVADGSISAGDPVGITSTGKVKTVSAVESNEVNILSTNGASVEDIKVISSDKFIVLYRNNQDYHVRMRIGTISGSSVTWGTEKNTGISMGYVKIAVDQANSSFCLYFRYEAASYRGYAMAGTWSGTTISTGSTSFVSNQNGQYNHNIEFISSGKYMSVSSGNPDYHIITTSGTSVTNVNTYYSGGYSISTVRDDDFNHIGSGIVIHNTGSYFSGWHRINGSGSSISSFAYNNNQTGGWDRMGAWYDTTNNYYVRMVTDAGACRIETWNVSNSNPANWSEVDTYTLAGGGYVWLSGEYLGSGVGVFTHKGPNADTLGVQKVTVDSSGNIFAGSVVSTSIDNEVEKSTYCNGSLVLPYKNSDNALKLRLVSLNSTYFGLIGLSEGNYSNGQTATITVTSGENASQSGLTIGQAYGVALNGTLTAGTTPTLGVATSTTKLLLT